MDYHKYTLVTKNSKEVIKNSVYFCFIGEQVDGHIFIEEAFESGASLVVGTKKLYMKNYVQVDHILDEFVCAAKQINKYNTTNMTYYGITGTDGKTSTALLTHQILNKLSTSAYLGTSGLMIGNQPSSYNGMTTPFADMLYRGIALANEHVDNFVMEVSSHALVQKRIKGLEYQAVAFTNLTNEHLDFHKTMEQYYLAKAEIINYVKPTGTVVINIDDSYGKKLAKEIEEPMKLITISTKPGATFYMHDLIMSIDGITFKITVANKTYIIKSNLLAKFNMYNLTMSIALVYSQGVSLIEIIKTVKSLVVPGRAELIQSDVVANCIVDFAHTPTAIEKIMNFVKLYKKDETKIYVIGGSAGGRDSSKRPLMGEAMAKYADYVILTEDDPRNEKVEDICKQLATNIKNYKIIVNRVEAIKFALTNTTNNDIIVLLGKAGQTKMYYDGFTKEYNEQEILKKLIEELK